MWVKVETDRSDARSVPRKKTRFLVDYSLGIEVANVMRAAGWNVKELSELGLQGHSDEAVYSLAWKEKRMLLTHDKRFWDDRLHPPERNPGVIILPGGSGDEAALTTALRLIHFSIAPYRSSFMQVKMWISSDGVLKTKGRDFSTGAMRETRYRLSRTGDLEVWKD